MVMFREDEERMIREARAARPRWRRWLGRGVKITLWAFFVFYVCLLILSRLGGRSDAMRAGLEQCLSQATGMAAHIGYLDHLAFYPLTGADFDDLTLGATKAEGPAIRVGHARVVMRFWDVLAGRTALAALLVEDFRAAPGALDPRDLAIERLAIDADGPVPRLTLKGSWGGRPLRGTLDLQHNSAFEAVSPAPFTLSVGGTDVHGTAKWRHHRSGMTLDFAAGAATGTLDLHPDGKGQRFDLGFTTGDGRLDMHMTRPKPGQSFDGTIAVVAPDAARAAGLLAELENLAALVPHRPVLHMAFKPGGPCRGTVTLGADGRLAPPVAQLCPAR